VKKLLLIAAALAALTTVTAANRLTVPVIVGGIENADACPGTGIVEGLDPHGDGFLAVKAGPGLSFDASTNSITARRSTSVNTGVTGWLSYTVGLAIGPNAATFLVLGQGQCPTPGHAVRDGSTAAGSAHSLDEFVFGLKPFENLAGAVDGIAINAMPPISMG
jgi:hypothetical protein